VYVELNTSLLARCDNALLIPVLALLWVVTVDWLSSYASGTRGARRGGGW